VSSTVVTMESADLRYPIGKFHFPAQVSDNDQQLFMKQIAETPANLRPHW
jgi:hypothetical protein